MSTSDCCTNVHEVYHEWIIKNFDFCEAKGGHMYSPKFSAPTNNKIKWKLKIRPNGSTALKDSISLYFKLDKGSEPEKVFGTYSVSIFNNKKGKYEYMTRKVIGVFVARKGCGWDEFCKKDEKFRSSFLSNNVLKISCEVKFSLEDDAIVEQQHYTSTPYEATAADFDVTANYNILLKTHLLSDVVISVGSDDFPAHKSILAAASKIFAAMFQHDTKENRLNRVDIEDMRKEVVGEMLYFIYTGRCEKLNEFAEELLAAADKYDLNPLKMLCNRALSKNLSIKNAARTLILADMHNACELKDATMKFIAAKPTEVFDTAEWKNVLTNPRLIDEVFRAAVRR